MRNVDPQDLVTHYYNKKRIYHLVRRVYRFLKDNPGHLSFVKIPPRKEGRSIIQNRGYYTDEDSTIEIDYRFEIIPTLIHECLHHFHSDWSERKVEKEERVVMALLSKKQALNLLKALAKAL